MIICICKNISDTEILAYCKQNPSTDIDIKKCLQVGSDCGLCEEMAYSLVNKTTTSEKKTCTPKQTVDS